MEIPTYQTSNNGYFKMVILIRNNKIHAIYSDTTDISPLENESIVVVPDNFNLGKLYQEAGLDTDSTVGFLGLPNPLEINDVINFIPAEELNIIKKKTASFNRVLRENNGVVWNNSRHKIDTKTCQSLAIAIISIEKGIITQPLAWRDADGNFAELSLNQLQELTAVVMRATEDNFKQEELESKANVYGQFS